MKYTTIVSGLLLLYSSAAIQADGFNSGNIAHLIEQRPLPDETLSSYRGGFMITEDYIVNIGLSITASIDGMMIFNTQIANLQIKNGDIQGASVLSEDTYSIANVIQVGSGNSIHSNTNIEAGTGNTAEALIGENSITHVIQNTLNNKVINLSTALNIDANVSTVIKQMQAKKKLEDSILSSFY